MQLYGIFRRNGWRTGEDLEAAAKKSAEVGDEPGSGVRWIRSYVLTEESGELGTFCVYEGDSPETVRAHAEAGIGKSRLAEAATAETGSVLRGAATEGSAVPYGPIVDALRSRLRTGPQALAECGPLLPHLALLLPELGEPAAALADEELLGDLLVGAPDGDEAQHLELAPPSAAAAARLPSRCVTDLLGKLDCRSRVEASHPAGELGLLDA